MPYELIEDPNDYPLFRMTANNTGGGFGGIIPLPFVQERAEIAVSVANWMGQYTGMTPRAVWAEIAVANDSSVPPALDPGGEASDKYFNIRLVPAGGTAADAFLVGVPCARFIASDVDTVQAAGESLASIYASDPGIASAVYVPSRPGR